MKKITFIITLVLFSGILSAQTAPDTTWTQMYSGGMYDWAWGVLETSDGGCIMVGDTQSAGAGSWDIGIIKTDEFGVTEWTQTYGGLYEDRGQCIQHTTDGGYIILGTTDSYGAGSYDIWLVKIDNAGNESWTQTFGGPSCDWGYYVEQTADGGYIITGAFDPGVYWIYDLFLIKTDSEGNAEWSKTFGEEDNTEVGHCVKQTSDGGYIITGYTYTNSAGSSDVWLMKTDEDGIIEWDNTFGDTEPEHGYSVIQSGEEYIVAGYTKSYGEGDYDVWLLKTDNAGNEIWNKTYGGTEDDRSFDIKPTLDNNYIIAGFTNSCSEVEPPNYYMWLLKTDNEGDTLWTKTIGNETFNRSCRARSVVQTSDGGYILAGDKYAGLDDGEYNYYLVKIDSEQGSVIDEKIQTEYSNYCYPNPTTGIFTIQGEDLPAGQTSIQSIEITNINGQVIKRLSTNNNQLKIDLSNQPKGIYFVKIQTDGISYTEKIILIK
ncbi:MAG: T9SS type A sorting domain-containing protein [Bacteroidales bacterium]|nr:T9SS type A sorting domain-containing protein [Bacteroidales bacterium]